MDKKTLPIGVFDSGLGGLTGFAELKKIMPTEDIIYFGDSARIPYGTKSASAIKKFALQDARFLLSSGVKAILVACGTVSSNCLPDIARETGLPVVGVIEASAKKAFELAGEKGTVAVLGTSATIKSGAYERELTKLGVTGIISKACPMFVPLVENLHTSINDRAANAIAEEYLAPIAEKKPDATILGCTHYPLLANIIQKYLPGTALISSGKEAACALRGELIKLGLTNGFGGKAEFFTSDDPVFFRENAQSFLGREITEPVRRIDIEKY